MANFGNNSAAHLNTVDPRLQKICQEVIEYYDFSVVCGHRNEQTQNAYHDARPQKSMVRWPDSCHNEFPSKAIDVAPWINGGIDWEDSLSFAKLAGLLDSAAHRHGFSLRWGGDWDRDGGSRDQSFMDIGHVEIAE